MPPAARHNDASIDGVIITGSPNTFINSRMAVRHAERTQCSHGVFMVSHASASVFINSLGAARVSDVVPCPVAPGVITTGSHNVFIGG